MFFAKEVSFYKIREAVLILSGKFLFHRIENFLGYGSTEQFSAHKALCFLKPCMFQKDLPVLVGIHSLSFTDRQLMNFLYFSR